VQEEAADQLGCTACFVTRWLGRGERMLDLKVTARNLEFTRDLADRAMPSIVQAVFNSPTTKGA
jgi:hypothetical protein